MAARILLTGAGGFVAGSILHQARGVEVHAVSRGAARLSRPNIAWHNTDVQDEQAMAQLLDMVKPTAVIHAAAIADIDYSQANQDTVKRLNTDATAALARLCQGRGIKLVHCSTDNVYDGEKGLYTEEDPTVPVNFYGWTKVWAEEAIRNEAPSAVIARVALVMGLPVIGTGNSFLAKFIAAWREGKTVGVPASETRSPIDVITLGAALLELAQNDFSGNINLGGSDILDRCTMAKQIAEKLGYGAELVYPNDPTDIPGRADRPRDVSFDNSFARKTLSTPIPGIEGGLDLILAVDKEAKA